jgi:hypothetical protein
VNGIEHLIEGWWWLIFIFGGTISGSVRQAVRHHHKRRLAVIAAKAELAERKSAALRPPPDPQPVCGCTHHLSFHNPGTSACAVDDCRCQQYIGPEPLGHVMAMPIIDPGRMTAPPPVHRAAPDQPVLDPPVLNPEAQI